MFCSFHDSSVGRQTYYLLSRPICLGEAQAAYDHYAVAAQLPLKIVLLWVCDSHGAVSPHEAAKALSEQGLERART